MCAYGASIVIQHYRIHDKEQDWGADSLEAVLGGIKEQLTEGATLTEFQQILRKRVPLHNFSRRSSMYMLMHSYVIMP